MPPPPARQSESPPTVRACRRDAPLDLVLMATEFLACCLNARGTVQFIGLVVESIDFSPLSRTFPPLQVSRTDLVSYLLQEGIRVAGSLQNFS